jgi:hypothetical protein
LTRQGFPIFSGTLYAIVGLWTQRSAVSFRKVVDTQGKDITHLIRSYAVGGQRLLRAWNSE